MLPNTVVRHSGINGHLHYWPRSSTPKAVKNAIHMAQRFVEERISQRIQEDIERNGDIQEAGATRRRKIWRHIRNHMSFRGERTHEDDDTENDADSPPPVCPLSNRVDNRITLWLLASSVSSPDRVTGCRYGQGPLGSR